jgi:hypothetical protein
MPKANSEELLEAVADDFHTFLRRGVRFEQVIGSAHAALDIDDIEALLRVHFVLTESDEDGEVGVLDFMRQLEDRIRQMKTTTAPQSHEYRGEVRGRIDWQGTVKSRAREGRLDEPVFVCSEPEEHYNIDENLVLKRLLTVIHEIVTDDLSYAVENSEGYEWLSAWTSPIDESNRSVESAADVLQRVYDRNVYLQRIDVNDVEVTDRTIESVKRSRSQFYREAAELLDRYRQLMRHELDAEEAREILNHTLIAPEKPETLFELYWIFRILNRYDSAQYRVLSDWRENPSTVARWEQGGSLFLLSHDSTGKALKFHEELKSQDIEPDGYLFRLKEVLTRWQTLSKELLHRTGSDSLWGGRPDIVLERFEENSDDDWVLEDVFIGEVKYTQDVDYVATGLRELLEYMAFVRHDNGNGDYVEGEDSVLESVSVKGLLFTDELDSEISRSTDEGVRIIEYPDSVKDPLG